METVAIPKMMVYIFDLMILAYIIQGIILIIKKIKHKKDQELNAAMDRMSKHYVDDSVKHPTFVNAVYDIPYEDAAKVFMLYEKFKQKKLKKERKWLEEQAEKMANGE